MIYLSTAIVCKFFFDVDSHNPLIRSLIEDYAALLEGPQSPTE